MSFAIAAFSTVLVQLADGILSGSNVDDSCCSYFAVPWKFIAELVLAIAITCGVTYQITRNATANRAAADAKARLKMSIDTIFSEIDISLRKALLATGDAKSGAAQELQKKILYHLGPMMAFMGPVGAAVKALDDAAKGEVAQERVCAGFACDKRNGTGEPHPPHPAPPPPQTPTGPVASAAAAGGAAASAAAGGQTIIITGNCHAGTHGDAHGPGAGMPSRRISCDCGKGAVSDYVSPAKATEKRRMTDREKSDAARAAVEQFAEVWRKDAITRQLDAIVTSLSTVKPRRKTVVTTTVNISADNVNLEGDRGHH